MTDQSKFFPIKTDTACKLKWTWSTILLRTGMTKSCHRVEGDKIDLDNFDNFHNTDRKILHRELMLKGEWPNGNCSYCKKIEDAGGQSDRINHLNIPGYIPDELEHDKTATHVTPKILEVYFDNTCNMGCIYCGKNLSSVLETEHKKFGDYHLGNDIIATSQNEEDPTEIVLRKQKMFEWLGKNHKTLERFIFLGGEPFYQKEFDQTLEFLENNPSPELEFNIITNLKVPFSKLQKYIERFRNLMAKKHLRRFDITCSIDCFSKEQEYVRYGINIENWKKNFEYLVQQKWIYLNINQTLNSLTIKTTPDLLNFVNNLKSENRNINHYFSLVVGGGEEHVECQHPGHFGPGYFDKDFDLILDQMYENTWQEKEAKQHMIGLKKSLSVAKRNNNEIQKLIKFLNEIDRRRNLDWASVFPWLVEEINKCGITR